MGSLERFHILCMSALGAKAVTCQWLLSMISVSESNEVMLTIVYCAPSTLWS